MEMQIKMTMRYHHLTPVRIDIIKNSKTNKQTKKINAGEDINKRELLHTAGKNVN